MEELEQEPRADVRGWLELVKNDLASAQKLAEDDSLLDNAAYHCQQAAEKVLKALFVYRGFKKEDWKDPYNFLKKRDKGELEKFKAKVEKFKKDEDKKSVPMGHDIGRLIILADTLELDDNIDSKLADRAILSTLAVDTRYYCADYIRVTRQEYTEHFENAKGFCQYVLGVLPKCYHIVI